MQALNIFLGFEACVFSSPSPARPRLTGRSSGHQYLPASIGTLRASHSGAAYLGRYAPVLSAFNEIGNHGL